MAHAQSNALNSMMNSTTNGPRGPRPPRSPSTRPSAPMNSAPKTAHYSFQTSGHQPHNPTQMRVRHSRSQVLYPQMHPASGTAFTQPGSHGGWIIVPQTVPFSPQMSYHPQMPVPIYQSQQVSPVGGAPMAHHVPPQGAVPPPHGTIAGNALPPAFPVVPPNMMVFPQYSATGQFLGYVPAPMGTFGHGTGHHPAPAAPAQYQPTPVDPYSNATVFHQGFPHPQMHHPGGQPIAGPHPPPQAQPPHSHGQAVFIHPSLQVSSGYTNEQGNTAPYYM